MSAVLTLGTFDTMHPGHVRLFQVCRLIAGPEGKVFVSVNTDRFVEEFKGTAPVQNVTERRIMVQSCQYVDEIRINDQQDAKPIIEEVKPHFLVIGSDWAHKDYYAQLQITPAYLVARDIHLLYLDRATAYSSTELKERVRAQ